jgi:hypothetical protein
MMICSDGKVIPCEQMPETEPYFCGDVSHQSILEVWNGQRLRELTYGVPWEKFKDTVCQDCNEWEQRQHAGHGLHDQAALLGNDYHLPVNCSHEEAERLVGMM